MRRGLLAVLLLTACGGERPGTPPGKPAGGPAVRAGLTGAGATFPNPIYQRWFDAYAKETGVRINYQSIGSGGGIKQFIEGTVDFGASDGPMTDQQIQQVRGNVLHVPTVLGAVVLTYHLPELGAHRLRLDGPAIADIFLGKVTAWNDRRLAALNPGVNLPARDLIVVHRSDGSGTTYIFTDYLSKISPEWASGVGRSTAVNWPVGLGGKGNEGVTQQVKQSDGALGYVELIYAVSNSLPYAQVRNAAGTFVDPSVESVSAAAASVSLPPETDFRVSITNPPGAGAYPISSFTWLLVRRTSPDSTKARLLEGFLTWMLGPEPQKMAAELNYAPLPAALVKLVRARIDGGGSVTRPLQARDRSRESSL